MKKAAKSLDGLDVLVQDLLTLSHIETGQIKMHFENIDLYKLTEEVFEQFEGKADKKDVALRIEGAFTKSIVYADWQRISQVMTNLISNAIKHSHDDSEVVVSFEVSKKNITTLFVILAKEFRWITSREFLNGFTGLTKAAVAKKEEQVWALPLLNISSMDTIQKQK